MYLLRKCLTFKVKYHTLPLLVAREPYACLAQGGGTKYRNTVRWLAADVAAAQAFLQHRRLPSREAFDFPALDIYSWKGHMR